MKALVLEKYNHLVLKQVPRPALTPGDVLIEVKACGICGSDVHGMDGSTGRRRPPIIMGHEASGVIAEVGGDVDNWKPGDRVTFDSTIYCGECFFCRRGQINLCDNRRVLGVSCDEYRHDGAFAEYVAVPTRILYPLPPDLSFEKAATVEALSIAVHAASRTRVNLNDVAVVVGTGMIGLLIVQVLRARGCGTIIAVDLAPEKLELAKELGADVGLRAGSDDVEGRIAELTNGRGADIALEVVGVDEAFQTAVAAVRKGGTLVLVGNLLPTAELPSQKVVTREITLRGSYASRGEYPACIDLIARGVAGSQGFMRESRD
jgi:L-iditol 2-dehydrogenase